MPRWLSGVPGLVTSTSVAMTRRSVHRRLTHLCPPPPQPSPSRREDRPVSFYQLGPSQLPSSAAALARDAGSLAKDKQRGFVPSILQNETYGAILSGSPPPTQPAAPGSSSAPPLPPRNVAKGTYRAVGHPGCGSAVVGVTLWGLSTCFVPS